MGIYTQLRELGFNRRDALLRASAYKLSGLSIGEEDIPERVIGDCLDTLEALVNPDYVSHARRPHQPSIVSKTSRSHLDTTLVALHVSYRFQRDLFSEEMTQRYEQVLQKVPETKKPLLDAINAIPENTSEAELSDYLRQIDEQYVVKRNK